MSHLNEKPVTQCRSTETILAGRYHRPIHSEFFWWLRNQQCTLPLRFLGYLLQKVFGRLFDTITVDQRSFRNAIADTSTRTTVVIVPTHRSYLDSIILPFIFGSLPQLGLPTLPRTACADEFSKVFGLRWLLTRLGAFYIKRGQRRKDDSLRSQIQRIVDERQTIMFYVEGTRSRSRQFLSPRRGLLRCLQSTGQRFLVFPVSVSYDHVPEQGILINEIKAGSPAKARVGMLVRWMIKVALGQVSLGRVHISCGDALLLDKSKDVHALSIDIIKQLQLHTTTTTFQLLSFIDRHSTREYDVTWLRDQIVARGGTVLESYALSEVRRPELAIVDTFKYHWIHYFFNDAIQVQPDNPAILHFVKQNLYCESTIKSKSLDYCTLTLLTDLFEPICREYVGLAINVRKLLKGGEIEVSRSLLFANSEDSTVAQEALCYLNSLGFIKSVDEARYKIRSSLSQIDNIISACVWRKIV